jgi:hypothetical protein
MTTVTCELSISVDGYSAGLNQTEERPFGDDGGGGWGDKLISLGTISVAEYSSMNASERAPAPISPGVWRC